MDTITLRKPDDWHTHLRDSAMLKAVAPFTARRFARAIVMPNLAPDPVLTAEDAGAYRERILAATKDYPGFTPLMTLYLTERTDPTGVTAVKLYPAHATTNSAVGVNDINTVYPVLEKMQETGTPLLLHGEDPTAEPKDREKAFLGTTLPQLLKDFPALKLVLEHVSSKDGVDFVLDDQSGRLASTVTLHHLMLAGETADPYLACMPIVKTEADRAALRAAVTSGDARFFLGTDSAPHPVSAKQKTPPAAGLFTAPVALELYAQIFEEEGKLQNFERFASLNGPAFYGLPPNEEKITLTKEPWTINAPLKTTDGDEIRPFGYDPDPTKRPAINWRVI